MRTWSTRVPCRYIQSHYHTKYMKEGSIPSYAYENFNEMYQAYHGLGGNSMVTKMKKEIDELHIKQKGE